MTDIILKDLFHLKTLIPWTAVKMRKKFNFAYGPSLYYVSIFLDFSKYNTYSLQKKKESPVHAG